MLDNPMKLFILNIGAIAGLVFLPIVTIPLIIIYAIAYRDELFSEPTELRFKKIESDSTPYMPYKEYQAYLRTEHWEKVRNIRWMIDDGICQQCKIKVTRSEASCHHISYRRLGDERVDDLVTLCTNCHKKIHEFYPKNSKYYPLLKN